MAVFAMPGKYSKSLAQTYLPISTRNLTISATNKYALVLLKDAKIRTDLYLPYYRVYHYEDDILSPSDR